MAHIEVLDADNVGPDAGGNQSIDGIAGLIADLFDFDGDAGMLLFVTAGELVKSAHFDRHAPDGQAEMSFAVASGAVAPARGGTQLGR